MEMRWVFFAMASRSWGVDGKAVTDSHLLLWCNLMSIDTNLSTSGSGNAGLSACIRVAGSFLRVQVVDEEFAVLAVAAWGVVGDFYHIPDGGCMMEDFVHFFERPVSRFGL